MIAAGRIVALGSDAQTSALAGQRAEVIGAGGRLVLPGFQDAHIHLLNGGVDLVGTAQLHECVSVADLRSVIARHAAQWQRPMVWGAGWQCGCFGDRNLTREILDAVVPDRPCLIYDGNFHNACVNSIAIAMARIVDDTPDPQNGHFLRDAAGRVTGMLHEDAVLWVLKRLPTTTEATLKQGLLAGQAGAVLCRRSDHAGGSRARLHHPRGRCLQAWPLHRRAEAGRFRRPDHP